MPSVDLVIPFLFLLFFGVYRWVKPYRTITYLVGVRVLAVSLFIHVALRSWVWMMFPLFLASALLILLGWPHLKLDLEKPPSLKRKILWGFALVLSISSFVLNALFPIRSIPEPTGALTVGTIAWDVHTQREERYAEREGDTRSFRVQAWYPASHETQRALWLGDGPFTSQGLARDFGFPGFIFNHLRHTRSHAHESAPVLEGSYPLVILSHGWSGFRQLHTDLAEELASHGYIVIGIEHTYGSVGTVFSDGTQRALNPQALPPRATTSNFLEYANALVETYAADIVSLLDTLETESNDDLKAAVMDRLDMSFVTVIGHSTGGGAAVKVGLTDSRIHAVIGLDAWVEPLSTDELLQGLSLPSVLIRSEGWFISHNNPYLKTLIDHSAFPPTAFQMNGTTHYDFGMVYMFTTLAPFIGLQGQRGLQMPLDQNTLVFAYLEHLSKTPDEPFDWHIYPDLEALVFEN